MQDSKELALIKQAQAQCYAYLRNKGMQVNEEITLTFEQVIYGLHKCKAENKKVTADFMGMILEEMEMRGLDQVTVIYRGNNYFDLVEPKEETCHEKEENGERNAEATRE